MSKLIPAPCIIPLCLPKFGKSKYIDTKTLIDLCCDKEAENLEIFYTVDGTKPQPYVDIVQGSKTHKFIGPFSLPPGKVTVKAITAHSLMPNVLSSIITKTFHVEQSSDIYKKPKEKNSQIKNSVSENLKCGNEEPKDPVLNSPVRTVDDSPSVNVSESCAVTVVDPRAVDILPEDSPAKTTQPLEQEECSKSNSMESPDYAEEINDLSSVSIEDISESSFANTVKEDIQAPPNPPASSSDELGAENTALVKCGIPLQHCYVCSRVNSFTSRYCDKCGTKLYLLCNNCEECNPTFAVFCQYCGVKISKDENSEEPDISCKELVKLEEVGVLVKPQTEENFTQLSSNVAHKFVQTVPFRKKEKMSTKHLPVYTPGRGYWHQQVDYICNYLKAHAYNNLDFRKQMSEPSLGRFLSADIIKSEEEVVVQLKFETFHLDQLTINGEEPSKADRL